MSFSTSPAVNEKYDSARALIDNEGCSLSRDIISQDSLLMHSCSCNIPTGVSERVSAVSLPPPCHISSSEQPFVEDVNMAHSDGLSCSAGPREGTQEEKQKNSTLTECFTSTKPGSTKRKRMRTRMSNSQDTHEQACTKVQKTRSITELAKPKVPAQARLLEGKQRVSYRTKVQPDGGVTRVRHYTYIVHTRKRTSRPKYPSPLCTNPSEESSQTVDPGIVQIHSVDGESIPELHSTEYEFDPDEYRRWNTEYSCNFDACASVFNHKCANYATIENSFLKQTAADRDRHVGR